MFTIYEGPVDFPGGTRPEEDGSETRLIMRRAADQCFLKLYAEQPERAAQAERTARVTTEILLGASQDRVTASPATLNATAAIKKLAFMFNEIDTPDNSRVLPQDIFGLSQRVIMDYAPQIDIKGLDTLDMYANYMYAYLEKTKELFAEDWDAMSGSQRLETASEITEFNLALGA